jgi:peptidoglycan biosynthesis protein MviN/MurJ (putative lipid II flippase)
VPEKISVIGVVINISISLLLKDALGFRALALASTLTNISQAAMLVWLLRRRLGPLVRSEILEDFTKILLCTMVMGFAVWGAQWALERGVDPSQLYMRGRTVLAGEVIALMLVAGAVYFPLSHALGLDYLGALLGKASKKI